MQYIYTHTYLAFTHTEVWRDDRYTYAQGAPRIISTPGPVDPYPFGGDGGVD